MAQHDLIFYENRSTPEVVSKGAKGNPKNGYGKQTRRRAANADEEKDIAAGRWVRVDQKGKKAGEAGYKKTKYRPQLVSSAISMRTYPVPAARAACRMPGVLGETATYHDLALAAALGNSWAAGVFGKENDQLVASLIGDDPRLPLGVTIGDGVITGLVRDDHTWSSGGWVASGPPASTVPLEAHDVAYVARSLAEGFVAVAFRPIVPVGFLDPSAAFTAAADPTVPSRPEGRCSPSWTNWTATPSSISS